MATTTNYYTRVYMHKKYRKDLQLKADRDEEIHPPTCNCTTVYTTSLGLLRLPIHFDQLTVTTMNG